MFHHIPTFNHSGEEDEPMEEAQGRDPVLDSHIRLLNSKTEYKHSQYERGSARGAVWALKSADYETLQRLDHMMFAFEDAREMGYAICSCIEGLDRNPTSNQFTEFVEEVLGLTRNTPLSLDFLEGFLDGAMTVLSEVDQ